MNHPSQTEQPIVLGMTGASGAPYAARLLEVLLAQQREIHLICSESGAAVIHQELGVQVRGNPDFLTDFFGAYRRLCNIPSKDAQSDAAISAAHSGLLHQHEPKDYFTPVASGSFLTHAMVLCPCSGSTLSGIAHSSSSNLIERAAEVHLKERRKLIVVPRETPLSQFQLENMLRLSQAGCVVLPAAPGWYHGVNGLADLVNFVVGRILDQLEIPNKQITRWAADE